MASYMLSKHETQKIKDRKREVAEFLTSFIKKTEPKYNWAYQKARPELIRKQTLKTPYTKMTV